jgi:hypothetical protein
MGSMTGIGGSIGSTTPCAESIEMRALGDGVAACRDFRTTGAGDEAGLRLVVFGARLAVG